VGVCRGCPKFLNTCYYPRNPGTGKATNFKFCTRFHTIDHNKSPLTISGKVAVGVARDSRFFFRASIYRAHRAVIFALARLSCFCCIVPNWVYKAKHWEVRSPIAPLLRRRTATVLSVQLWVSTAAADCCLISWNAPYGRESRGETVKVVNSCGGLSQHWPWPWTAWTPDLELPTQAL